MGVCRFNVHSRPCPSCYSPAQKGGQEAQGLGRSRGGLGTKIHASVDALGLPIRIVLAAGNRGDVIYGKALIEGLKPAYVIADRAYDAEHFHDSILDAGAIPVIPPRSRW